MIAIDDYQVFNMVGDVMAGPTALKMHMKHFANRDIALMEKHFHNATGPTVVMQLKSVDQHGVHVYEFVKEKR